MDTIDRLHTTVSISRADYVALIDWEMRERIIDYERFKAMGYTDTTSMSMQHKQRREINAREHEINMLNSQVLAVGSVNITMDRYLSFCRHLQN